MKPLVQIAATVLVMLSPVAAAQRPTPTPIPIEAMASDPALQQMQLSPDGKHIAGISTLAGGAPAISIWKTDSLSENPRRFGIGGAAERRNVRFASIDWVANDRLLVILQQPLNAGAGAQNATYTALARIVDLTGQRWIEPLAEGGRRTDLERYVDRFLTVSLVSDLPDDPQHVLMLKGELDLRAVYKVNVYTGVGERVLQLGGEESLLPIIDRQGRLRVKEIIDRSNNQIRVSHEIFDTASSSWQRHDALSYDASTRRGLSVVRLDPANEDLLFVADNEGSDRTYIRSYSISQRRFVEKVFEHPKWEASGVVIDNLEGAETKPYLAGFAYDAATTQYYFVDGKLDAINTSLRQRLPGREISIGRRYGNHRVVIAESSRHPTTYLLLTNDTDLQMLGVSRPGIDANQLADTQLVYYPARDGLQIPAFLTLPKGWARGQAPLPVIIQPHGGPWSRNSADWGGGDIPVTQYFASRGFAVLQPQFRGSTGFGDRLWKAGDGQWGLKMQDDKDDGLAWLVSQGIGDPNRAIIYGFSYGGFAAMAATVRPNPPYRCAISGAGVSSLERLGTLWSENRVQRVLQGRTVKGFDPLQNVRNASIPILVYHGDRDQTATLWHSEQFVAGLRSAGKPHEFVIIKDMPHGPLNPEMRRKEFEIVENYIKGPCGIAY